MNLSGRQILKTLHIYLSHSHSGTMLNLRHHFVNVYRLVAVSSMLYTRRHLRRLSFSSYFTINSAATANAAVSLAIYRMIRFNLTGIQ